MNEPRSEPDRVRFREISPTLESVAWLMVMLAPLLCLANGPPVTDDQWYIQVFVAMIAGLAAVGLRIYNWRVRLDK